MTKPITAAQRLREAIAAMPAPDRRTQRKHAEQYQLYRPEERERYEQLLGLQTSDRELFDVVMKQPTARIALGMYIAHKAAYEAEQAEKGQP